MSTVLIDTDGGSTFRDGTNLVSTETKIGQDVANILKEFSISLNDSDNKPILKPRGIIDVINNFSWYAGPKATAEALNKIPCVFLTEREQLLSSMVSGALYYLNQTADVITAIGNSKFVDGLVGKITKSEAAKSIVNSFASGASEFLAAFGERTSGTGSDRDLLKANNLKSLEGIYFTKPTGFQYRLPIYSSPDKITNSWSDTDPNDNLLTTFKEGFDRVMNNISNAVNIAQPGVYIEKPMYFQGPVGRTETITFPLANTISRSNISPLQQNYELLWLLAFQNKPYKTSFARTNPPKIYQVAVPGQFSMPYAYISNMSVDFKGTVRKARVFVPTGNGVGTITSKPVEVPVPEVYEVSISFTSLIKDYGNTMLGANFLSTIDSSGAEIGSEQ